MIEPTERTKARLARNWAGWDRTYADELGHIDSVAADRKLRMIE